MSAAPSCQTPSQVRPEQLGAWALQPRVYPWATPSQGPLGCHELRQMVLQELHASEVVQRKVLRIWIRWASLLRQICMHRVALLMLRLSERKRTHHEGEKQFKVSTIRPGSWYSSPS